MNENISQVIDKLAERLGATGAHLFEVIARQTVISGVVWSVIYLALIVLIPLTFVKSARLIRKHQDAIYHSEWEALIILGMCIGGLLLVILFLVAVFCLPDSVMMIFNQEYYAIKDILQALN
ncbi:hypothetical protein [Paenibacillus sp. Marseille-Q9583]